MAGEMGNFGQAKNFEDQEKSKSEKGREMLTMPDGTAKDVTDMTPDEIREEIQSYHEN